jgi:hypothetical protein
MSDMLFFQDELKVMERRLGEVASKNTAKETLANLEHFQNTIIVERNNVDQIKHELNIGNDEITNEIHKNVIAIDHRSIADHAELREKVESFKRVYHENKNELNSFLSKWM